MPSKLNIETLHLELRQHIGLPKSQGPRIVSPNITLHPVWEGEFGASPVRLICTLSGFFPDKLSVNWQRNNRPLNIVQIQRKLQSMDGVEKTFSLSSEIEPNMKEWADGSSFKCKSNHNNLELMKTISICQFHATTSPSIHVEIPSFKTVMMAASEVKATCLVHTTFNAKVTWLMDGTVSTSNTVSRDTNKTHIISKVTVSSDQWKRLKQITCRVEHDCFSSTERTVNVAATVTHSKPSATLLQGSGELVCLAFGFSPASIDITWFLNDTKELFDYYTGEPHRGPDGKFSIQSHLRLTPVNWSPGAVVTCRVTHVNSTLSLNISKPDILEDCRFLDTRHADVNPDVETWYIAFTFLLFFLIALIYGVLATIIKTR